MVNRPLEFLQLFNLAVCEDRFKGFMACVDYDWTWRLLPLNSGVICARHVLIA